MKNDVNIPNPVPAGSTEELLRRWRLIFGPGKEKESDQSLLDPQDIRIDKTLDRLFDTSTQNILKRSRPVLNEWLKDIRELFPTKQTLFLQKKAIETLGLKTLLFEKETLHQLTPAIELIKTILLLKDQIPEENINDVRNLVRAYAEKIEQEIEWGIKNTLQLYYQRGEVTYHPRKNEIDWKKTIKRNLKYYQPELGSIVIQSQIGHEKRRHGFPSIILLVDSSASMTDSLIYSAIIASILAYIPTISTKLVLFDSDLADMTDELHSVEKLLFNIQLGGGTDISRALEYAKQGIQNPDETYLFLISDLYDNFNDDRVFDLLQQIHQTNTTVHCILSMTESGQFNYNKDLAQRLSNSGIPCYSATPDQFGNTLEQALSRNSSIR